MDLREETDEEDNGGRSDVDPAGPGGLAIGEVAVAAATTDDTVSRRGEEHAKLHEGEENERDEEDHI